MTWEKAVDSLQVMENCSRNEALNKFMEFVNLCDSTDGALEKVLDMKKKFYLAKHNHTIGYLANKKLWQTYVPAPNTKSGRKPITAKTKPLLENKIAEYYEMLENTAVPTINSLADEFIAYKGKETSLANANKLAATYKKYIKDEDIANMPLDKINPHDLSVFFDDIIKRLSLTKRLFNDIKSFINMLFDYAIIEGKANDNVSKKVHVPYKKFTPTEKKTDDERVFIGDELDKLRDNSPKEFDRTGNVAYLAIALNTYMGLRVGELVALEWSDIYQDRDGYKLHISKQEVANYVTNKEGNTIRDGCMVVPYTKSRAGDRFIPLTVEALEILDRIKAVNEQRKINSTYIFIGDKGERLHKNGVNNPLRKLNKKLGIKQKANHATRRTVISKLYESGLMTDKQICSFAGHESIKTTQNSYLYSTRKPDELPSLVQRALA